MASWLTRNLPGILSTIGGAAMTATGVGAGAGIPLMIGGAGMLGADATNEANKKSAERATGINQDMQREAQMANANEASKNRAFQEQMSNSAQTRARQDAINAGYNPMLPAINSNSASTPSGGQGSSTPSKAEWAQATDKVGSGLASAVSVRKLMNELDGTNSQIGLNNAMGAKAAADANASTASAKESNIRQAALKSQLGAISKKAKYDAEKAGQDLKYLPLDGINQRVNQTTNSAKGVLDVLNPARTLPGGTRLYKGKKGEMVIDGDGVIKRQF